jgi:uncharacterized protein DUF4832/uncharacterized protein DUF4874
VNTLTRAIFSTVMLALAPMQPAAQTPSDRSERLVTVTFQPTDDDVINPERGFSRFAEVTVSQDALNSGRAQGHSVFWLMITMSQFRDAPLSDAFLAQIQTAFDRGRAAGVKFIPRFRYDSSAAGRDAPLPIVLQHIAQITPVLHKNKDVIVNVEAGFVGAWGEWHSSTNGLTGKSFGSEINDSTRAIIAALLKAVPADRMIAVRTPRYKKQLMGDERNLTVKEAFSGTERARIGFHNDCFLASPTDTGTYGSGQRQAELDWLNKETRYVPHEGETCSAAEAALPFIACKNAIQEMNYTNWRTLNIGWHPAVYKYWEANGCMGEIRRRLGYRFVLKSAKASASVPVGGSLRLHLEVENAGFATPLNERPVEVVLRHVTSGRTHSLSLEADPRRWWNGETHDYMFSIPLSANITPGDYDLLVNLPDAAPNLRKDARYSIRFANTGTWEESSGFNTLGLRVSVVSR